MASRKKVAAQVDVLREEALSLIVAQKHEQAIKALETLISIDPKNPEWPRRAAESHWYLKDTEKRLEYSALAAKIYADGGLLLKAIAMCKVALSIDPTHRETQEQLARLKAERPQARTTAAVQPKPRANPLVRIRQKTQAVLQKKREQAESARQIIVPALDSSNERRVEAARALQSANARQRVRRAQARMEAAAKVRAARVRHAQESVRPTEIPPSSIAPGLNASSTNRDVPPSLRVLSSKESFPPVAASRPYRQSGRPLEQVSLSERVIAIPKKLHAPLRGGVYSLKLEEVPSSEFKANGLPSFAPRRAPSLRVVSPHVIEPPAGLMEIVLPSIPVGHTFHVEDEVPFTDASLATEQPTSLSDVIGTFSKPFFGAEEEVLLDFVDREPDAMGFALENAPFLGQLDPVVLRDLISELDLVEVERGNYLFKEGDTADAMYVIVEGELVATTTPQGSPPIEIAHLEEGEFFGEIGLLSDQPRQASVMAKVNSRLLRFDREAINQLTEQDPHFLTVLLSFLRGRLLEGLMNTSPLFAPFNEQERLDLADRFEFLELEPDAVLLDPGQRPVGMYVLLTGEALCTGAGGQAGLRCLGPGDIFGERALLADAASDLEVVTVTKSFALCLPSDSFFELIMTHPTVRKYVSTLGDDSQQGGGAPLDHVAFF